MYKVRLECRGNIDFGENPNRSLPGVRARTVRVATLREASEVCRAWITEHGLGGGHWTGGQVTDERGAQVAYISYNGRAWEPTVAHREIAL